MPSAAIASCTIRTARSRSSSGYRRWLGCFFCSDMELLPFPSGGVSNHPGAVHSSSSTLWVMALAPQLGYDDLPRLLTRMTGDEKHNPAAFSTLDVLWVLYDRVLREERPISALEGPRAERLLRGPRGKGPDPRRGPRRLRLVRVAARLPPRPGGPAGGGDLEWVPRQRTADRGRCRPRGTPDISCSSATVSSTRDRTGRRSSTRGASRWPPDDGRRRQRKRDPRVAGRRRTTLRPRELAGRRGWTARPRRARVRARPEHRGCTGVCRRAGIRDDHARALLR